MDAARKLIAAFVMGIGLAMTTRRSSVEPIVTLATMSSSRKSALGALGKGSAYAMPSQ